MQRYVARRLLQAIPTFFGITVIAYLIMALSGDPIAILAFDPTMRKDERERLAIRLGVSDPIPVQYLRWLVGDDWMLVDTNADGEVDAYGNNYGILRGDFGDSFKFRGSNPLHLIAERLGATIELNVAALLVGYSVAIVLGVLAAVYRGKAFDRYSRIFSVMGDSFPSFWLGLLLIMFFGIALPRALEPFGLSDGSPLLPMGGRCPPVRGGCPPIFERLQYLVSPVLVIALGTVAALSRLLRAQMLETISSDYIRTARAKGLPSRSVWIRHALRNAFIPFTVFLGPLLFGLIGGSVVIERVFSWPGVGLLLLDAAVSRDYPVVMASVVISSILAIFAYLLSDILLVLFDPRVRL